MFNIKQYTTVILDCTLRDGGYYTKWNFQKSFENYLKTISKLNITFINEIII